MLGSGEQPVTRLVDQLSRRFGWRFGRTSTVSLIGRWGVVMVSGGRVIRVWGSARGSASARRFMDAVSRRFGWRVFRLERVAVIGGRVEPYRRTR